MNTLFFTTLAFWLLAATGTVLMVARFRRYVERATTIDAPPGFADGEWPEALVVMSLRGGDESLRQTLNGLSKQNYPNYRIRLVVDHRNDEVNEIIRSWRSTHAGAPVSVETLREPLPSCTLKCSAVHQVIRELDPDVGLIVLVDGDSDPYPNWLRDVAAPFADAEVGGVTGNRWYFPREGGLASWARFVFTAFSLPTMSSQRLAWGGTLAIRGEIARSETFQNAFAETPTEEQTCFETFPKFGKKMHFSSQLIQWNPESIGVDGSEQHLFRQLAWSRLFYTCWTPIIFGAVALWSALIASFMLAVFAFNDQRPLWLLPLALVGLFCATIVNMLTRLHQTLQSHVFTPQGRTLPAMNLARIADLFVALPVSLAVYSIALVRAHFATEIRWRGILYRVFSDDTISMTGYKPWKPFGAARRRVEVRPARAPQAGRQPVGS